MTSSTPIGMVMIPEGNFLMGVKPEETEPDPHYPEIVYLASACPQREIYLSAYYIDIYPVTNKEYKEFIDDTGHHLPRPQGESWSGGLELYAWDEETECYPEGTGDYPVVLVSWYDALAYCEWAGKRLPTEVEWEKAARGTDGRPYPWGWDSDIQAHAHVYRNWWKEASNKPDKDIMPVGSYPSGISPYGCYDMLGNIHEWCADWYDETYYARMPTNNPQGPECPGDVWGGPCRTARGTGRFHKGSHIHVAERTPRRPWDRNRGVGFRCALSLNKATGA